ncbi:MAG: B12-binding domain-containing radical SAM protein [Nitrospirae bacterium]|nr:B12-binding domain-containing radical SAM protein [Nitrospirota bacterium]
MKVLLINPENKKSIFAYRPEDVRAFWFPKLSLPTIAAYTPPDVEVKIVDECVEELDFNVDVDIVGISVMTYLSTRAYEIAAKFRARGVKVVLGGIHVSMCPEEAKEHADSVVVGEAEKIWPILIEDFRRGEMKPMYVEKDLSTLEGLPIPRRDLLKPGAYWTTSCVQTSRGCPFACDFCTVTIFGGNQFRLRPVEEVIEEVRRLNKGYVVFVDDNIAGHKAYAKQLFKALAPLKISWASQASLTMARDPELLELAAKSGCTALFLGVESISADNLAAANKRFNKVEKFREEFKRFHDFGILITTGMIFGFDNDDETVFERTVEFLEENRIELAMFNILTPLPGTNLYKRMDDDGRIIDRDWTNYDGRHVVFQPKLMSPETLEEGFFWAYHSFFSIPSVFRRVLPSFWKVSRKKLILDRLAVNYAFRRIVKRVPEGRLSPLAKILNGLQGRLPSIETEGLIPNALATIREKIGTVSGQVSNAGNNLYIKVRKSAKVQALLIELHGTMDKINATELKDRIISAVDKSKMDIVINFENLRETTPAALSTLFDIGSIKDKVHPYKIKCTNLRASFGEALERINQLNLINPVFFEIPADEVY